MPKGIPSESTLPAPASTWVRFNRKYDHTWPSRAVTCYPAGFSGRVRGHVAEAAIATGAAEEVETPKKGADVAPAETLDTSTDSK